MNEKDTEMLLTAWIALHETGRSGALNSDPNFWAFEALNNLCSEQPEICWKVILAILARTSLDRVLANLAAGPLEDLLAQHGPEYIEIIETQARRDSDFRKLLGGVWQNSMTEEIWSRVCTVSGTRW